MTLQGGFDRWFGRTVRVSGLLLGFYAVLVDKLRTPWLLPFAAGLMGLKNIIGAGK